VPLFSAAVNKWACIYTNGESGTALNCLECMATVNGVIKLRPCNYCDILHLLSNMANLDTILDE
jgi:hypothetical protein